MTTGTRLVVLLLLVGTFCVEAKDDAHCPDGYDELDGWIKGWGQIEGEIKLETAQDCSTKCDASITCCSFEWSPTAHLCNLNSDCLPTKDAYLDYIYCSKGAPYVKYVPGTLPLIISVPHNGYDRPTGVPDRQGCEDNTGYCQFTFPVSSTCPEEKVCGGSGRDLYTRVIGEGLYNGLQEALGAAPHFIISHMFRNKMEPNMEVLGAAQENTIALQAYETYHRFLKEASDSVTGTGPGLLLDIHGQVHKQNSIELGYTISKSDLNSGNLDASKSSIRSLVKREGPTLDDLLTGPTSFGSLLEDEGFHAVPSDRQPTPGNQKYFSGGYITKTYGSRYDGTVDAIQIEVNSEVSNDDEMRGIFIKKLVIVVTKFLEKYYNM